MVNSEIKLEVARNPYINNDWYVSTIGSVIAFEGGSQPPRDTFIFEEKEGYIRLLQIRDYKTSKYASYIPENLARRKCTAKDIMIGRYGPPIFQILRGLTGAYNVALIKAIPNSAITNDYAWYVLNQKSLFDFIEKLSRRTSGQTGVDLIELRKFEIPIPAKITEQVAITTALSDVDTLISSLERLIIKKKNIKTGVMQELLKPKEDWKEYEILDLLNGFQNGYAFNSQGYKSNGIPIVTMSQIGLDGIFQFDENKVNFWDPSEMNTLVNFHLKDGDLIIAMTDVTPEKNLIGRMSIVKTKTAMLLNQRVGHLRINKARVNPIIMVAMSNQNKWRKYCISSASLGVQANIGTKDILCAKMILPKIEEQDRIAKIFVEMDAEIKFLEKKLYKTRLIKQGMMQQLLTGKIRIL